MHLVKKTIIAGTFSAAALTFLGCATHTKHERLTVEPAPAPAHVSDRPQTPAQLVHATPPAQRVGFSDETSDIRRRTVGVGVFGEFVGNQRESISETRGTRNLSQVTFAIEGADFDPDIDPEGKWVVFASTQHRTSSDIYLKPVNGRTMTKLTDGPGDNLMPRFSPDGTHIAFASDRDGSWNIYIMPVKGGQPQQITSDPAAELHPSWSPDGRRMVYCRFGEQSQRWEMWLVDVANPGVKHFLDYGLFPQWSPDPAQNRILFQRARQRGSRFHSVWTVDLVNDQATAPTEIISASNAAIINPTWSPDGGYIAFVTVVDPETQDPDMPTQSDLWTVRLDGGQRTIITAGEDANYRPVWSRDGRIYFVSNRTGTDTIWSVAVNAGYGGGGTMVNVPTQND